MSAVYSDDYLKHKNILYRRNGEMLLVTADGPQMVQKNEVSHGFSQKDLWKYRLCNVQQKEHMIKLRH